MTEIDTLLLSVMAGALALACLVIAVHVLYTWDMKRNLRITMDSLRENIATAQTWVETKPSSKEAEEWLKLARKIHDEIEDGLKNRVSPYALARRAASVAVEMAIHARFRAMGDKKL